MDALLLRHQVTTGSGGYLIPEDLNPAINEYLARISPPGSMIQKKRANGKTMSMFAEPVFRPPVLKAN